MNVSIVASAKKQTLPEVGEPYLAGSSTPRIRISDRDGEKACPGKGAGDYLFGVAFEDGRVYASYRSDPHTVLKPINEGKVFEPA